MSDKLIAAIDRLTCSLDALRNAFAGFEGARAGLTKALIAENDKIAALTAEVAGMRRSPMPAALPSDLPAAEALEI